MNITLKNKVEFVYRFNKALSYSNSLYQSDFSEAFVGGVERVDYVILTDKVTSNEDEFIVIHYRGGAISARFANWNSISAIIKEIGPMLTQSQLWSQDTQAFKKKLEDRERYDVYNIDNIEDEYRKANNKFLED